MLEFAGDKMSKSVGNVERLRDALDEYGAETLLLLFAQAHYRSPLEYSPTTLEQARAGRGAAARGAARGRARRRAATAADAGAALRGLPTSAAVERFDAALDDDLGTPEAVAALFGLARELNHGGGRRRAGGCARPPPPTCSSSRLDVLGLAGLDGGPGDGPPAEVATLAEERDAARAARDFARADALRDEIAALGWDVRDTAQGREFRRR